MHRKERLADEPFLELLGARVTAPTGLDTDRLGTFAGDVPRTLIPIDAARVKARIGMHIDGTTLGMASEGTFAAARDTPGLVENTELLLFLDDELGIEVVETSRAISPLPGPTIITDLDAGLAFATRVGFPKQGVVVTTSGSDGTRWQKDFPTIAALRRALEGQLSELSTAKIQPDYRAHACPSRAEHLRSLSDQLAHRLATPCPACSAPGWGDITSEAGLPCRNCGEPTRVVAATVAACARCSHRVRTPVDAPKASPEWCVCCNP